MPSTPFSFCLSPMELEAVEPAKALARLLSRLDDARAQGASLVVFPACSPLGRLPGGAPLPAAFLREETDARSRAIAATRGLVAVFGGPENPVVAEDGRELHATSNGLYATSRAGLLAVATGSPALWDGGIPPPTIPEGARFLVVPDASPFARGRLAARARLLSTLAKNAACPILSVNATGVQDRAKVVGVFEGTALAFDASGARLLPLPLFPETGATVRLPAIGAPFGTSRDAPADGTAEVVGALRQGLSRFLRHLRLHRVVIGISGGIDSAVSTALYGSVLPPEDILLVGMPGSFTSATTLGLGRRLAANLGARYAEIPIGDAVELTRREFAALESKGPGDNAPGAWALSPFAMENVQARDRGSRVLAAASAAFRGVVSCNANKAEYTVGYGTLYGDLLGWLACLGDLWKGDVYAVGHALNDSFYGRDLIPEGIFAIRPSAELSASQSVDKGLGDPLVYPYHDKLFRSWVEDGATPAETLDAYLDGSLPEAIGFEGDLRELFATDRDFIADLERWWTLFRGLAVAKRIQAPPVLAMTRRPFGSFAEAQASPRFPQAYLARKAKLPL
ncbi:MAG: NAD(+) synthase [Kiritimatiellia bacterium]|jgi:NAD+ synthase (glutamine-hydrolysing)